MTKLSDIRDKYFHNVSHIIDYIEYLETFFLASICRIDNLKMVTPTFFQDPITANLCDKNSVIKDEMARYLDCIATEMRSLNIKEKNPNNPCGEDPTPEGDVIFSLMVDIRKGESNPERLFQNAQSNITAMCMMKGDDNGFEGYYLLADNPSRVRTLVEIAIEEEKRRKYKSLCTEHSYISMSIKSLELFDTSNQINLYKQNFIQVMAYFDSCIFDMVRLCMNQNFFEWLSYFDNVNIKTHDIANCNDFDSFKNAQVEAFLKKCYVKDLLNILRNRFDGIFTIKGTDIYPVIQEMIGRRNVHIHHNGIADHMYTINFNTHKASTEDYLEISKEYLEHAVDLTKKVVSSIASLCV